jgi:error-prone DNA polymerase
LISACLRKVGDGTADQPFSVDDLWCRAAVASLVQLAEADAMNESLGLARREALWALNALRDELLKCLLPPRSGKPERARKVREPAVSLRPMMSGGEVVEDYRHVGLTLRQHPASFLRTDLASCRIVTCADAMNARDGKWLTTAGLVLVRQNRIRQGRHVHHDRGRDRRRQPRHLAVAL